MTGAFTQRAAGRLYEVSRDSYAPALATFAAEWLDEVARQTDGVAVCLARDGLAPFLAARTLLRVHPRRFRGIHSRNVRLAHVSRPLAQRAAADVGQAALLRGYLRGCGVPEKAPLIVVDIGIHGSIQDSLQQIYPERTVNGRYLLLRRRAGDPNGTHKRGFLADLDVAHSTQLKIASLPPPPGWEIGGRLRRGDPLFLRARSIYVLEDLWNGLGESAAGLAACGERVKILRHKPEQTLVLPVAPPLITPSERVAMKRAALRGIVDGVAVHKGQFDGKFSGGASVPPAAERLAAWLGSLDHPAAIDAQILDALVRRRSSQGHPEESDT
jgi:hypothetical protein